MITIGCDPEGFLVRDGKAVSSIGKIGGSKAFPLPVPGGALLEDNVMVEFNTEPVNLMGKADLFVQSITSVQKHLNDVAELYGCKVVYTTEMEFSPEELEHPQARQSGCDPDYNIYLNSQNKYPELHPSLRGAGGHVHIGLQGIQQHPNSLKALLCLLDYKVGAVFRIIEGAKVRDRTYGRYGNFRIKPYGIEYRTPSCFWLQHPLLMKLMFTLVQGAVTRFGTAQLAGNFQNYISASPEQAGLSGGAKKLSNQEKVKLLGSPGYLDASERSLILSTLTILEEKGHVYT